MRVTRDPDKVATSRMVVFPGQSAFGAATQAIVDGAMGAALRMVIERGDPFLGICLGMQLLFDGSDENGGQEGLHVMPGRCRRFPPGRAEKAEPGAVERDMKPVATIPENASPAQSMASESSGPPVPAPSSAQVATSNPPATNALAAAVKQVSPEPAADQPAPAKPQPAPLMRRIKVPHMGWNEVEPTGDHYYFVHSYYVEPARTEDVMWMTRYGGIRFPAVVRRGNVLGCQFHPEKSQRAGLRFLRAFLLGGWG